MKVAILCLFMIALAVNADKINWAGKYIPAFSSQHSCAPRGVVTVTQDDTKGTIKGKWDPFSDNCKAFEIADQAFENNEGVLTDDTLTFTLKTKNETEIKLSFYKEQDKSQMKVQFLTEQKPSASGEAEKQSDEQIEQTNTFLGTYKFKLTEGDAAKCCLPASLEAAKQDTAVLYTTGKWENSEGCKAQKLGDVAWEKVGAVSGKSDGKFGLQWMVVEPMTAGVIQMPDEKKPDELTFMITTVQGCKISATKTASKKDGDDNKWWIYAIIAVVAVLVVGGIVGYVVYNKRKNANSQRTPLMNA